MLNGSQHLGDNNACHRLGFRSLTGWVFSPSNSTASLFGCARSRTRSGRVHDINVEPSDGVAEPRPAGSAHGPAGPPKVMKTPHLAGESACPTLASKGLRFRGAGAFACQPIFLSHLDRRLQRSDTTSAASSGFVVALPASRGSVFHIFLYLAHQHFIIER